jgi:hypothetical protein
MPHTGKDPKKSPYLSARIKDIDPYAPLFVDSPRFPAIDLPAHLVAIQIGKKKAVFYSNSVSSRAIHLKGLELRCEGILSYGDSRFYLDGYPCNPEIAEAGTVRIKGHNMVFDIQDRIAYDYEKKLTLFMLSEICVPGTPT